MNLPPSAGIAPEAAKTARSLLSWLLKAPAQELGLLMKDKVASRRHRNLVQIVLAAKKNLDDAGLSPKEVPLSIIHPMLEAASLEEDTTLQELWAALITNAIDPREPVPSRAFSGILRDLSPLEARLLKLVYSRAESSDTIAAIPLLPQTWIRSFREILAETNNGEALAESQDVFRQFELVLDNLERLRLAERRLGSRTIAGDGIQPLQILHYALTHLGVSFIRACQRSK